MRKSVNTASPKKYYLNKSERIVKQVGYNSKKLSLVR